jgi:hypothetical protein
MRMGGQRHVPSFYFREKDTVPIVQGAGWAPGPVSACAENLTFFGIRPLDRRALSKPLYRLSYPGPYYGTLCNSKYELEFRK